MGTEDAQARLRDQVNDLRRERDQAASHWRVQVVSADDGLTARLRGAQRDIEMADFDSRIAKTERALIQLQINDSATGRNRDASTEETGAVAD